MVRHESNGEFQNFQIELMRKTLKNISDDDIDIFLYYDTEAALQIVNDLVDAR